MSLALALLALQSPAPDAAPPHPHDWDAFPVFVWRETYAGKPLPPELVEPFGGVILMRGEDSSWARERDLSYLVWNVAGRDALHLDADAAWSARVERWIETRDGSLLVREPCLDDPETLARLHATLDETLAKHGEQPGLGFVLGDEVSLTPGGDPFDLCRCEHSERAWKKYARERGFPERAPLTDDVRLALLKDDFSLLGPWLARRRFDRERMVALLEGLRQYVASWSVDENRWVEIGLLGCSGATPFGGVALDELACQLDFVECYRTGTTRELVETVPPLWRHGTSGSFAMDPRPLSIKTLFLADDTAAGLAWGVWEHWLRGGNGLVLWSDASLAALSPEGRARLEEAVAAVRELQEAGVRPDPAPRSGIALVDDDDSRSVSFLRDALRDGPTWPRRRSAYQEENGTRERKLRTWLRLLEDCGVSPACLPLAKLCDDCTNAYRVLVLPELLVLDDERIAQLQRHVEQGGIVVVDGELGWVDRTGRPIERSVIDLLRREHPERVLVPSSDLGDYLERRWDPERAVRARDFVRRVRGAQPAQWSPSPEGEGAAIPWLTARFGESFVLLPNCATPPERRERLRDLPLSIEPPPGHAIEWLHPADGKVLRAGDAAVFRLRPLADAESPGTQRAR
jgi:hypothetical protein